MESKAKFLGHPVHQMLIVFPLGLLATAVVFDLIHLVTDNPAWSGVSRYLIAAGLIGGLLAAPFGFIDWRAIPDNTRAKSIGLAHGAGNLVVVLLFFVSWLFRRDAPETPTALALLFSFAGAGLALVTAWLGGELVVRLGVGVYDDANLNASNSLTHKKSA
jgi:uncharacterized membrane protein